jgi:hypothetical protein
MVRVDPTGPLVLVRDTLALENTVVILAPGGALAWRPMVPVNPLRLIKVMIDVPLVPVLTDTDVGVALAPKFGTGILTVTVKV